MSDRARLFVVGGTGWIGSHLLRLLAEEGHRVRALSRDPSRGEDLPGVDWVEGDLEDRSGLSEIFRGTERLFLLTGNSDRLVRREKNALEAARQAGVLHVVKLSALGATDHSRSPIGLWHWVVEEKLRTSGMAWTILRPHHFMQNLLDQREAIRKQGVVRSPAGDGKIPFIDTRDIAAVAAAALTEPGHGGEIYTLTGEEARSYREATEILAEVTGRSLEFVPEDPEEARERMKEEGFPDWLIYAQLAIAAYQRQGGPTARTTETVEELLGRPPRTLRDFAEDHAGVFER